MSNPFYHPDYRLGILGGGQLGRMLIQKALDFDVRTKVLDPSADAPCASIATEFEQGDFTDHDTVMAFGKDLDLLTIEIENVNVEALEALEEEGVTVHPQPWIIRMTKDKGLQKSFFEAHGIPASDHQLIEGKEGLKAYTDELPVVQKLRKGGYDGKGVMVHETPDSLEKGFDAPSLVEEKADIDKEISMLVTRNPSGDVQIHEPVEMEFDPDANLVRYLFCPAMIGEEVSSQAYRIAEDMASTMGIIGILAIEMFVTKSEQVLVNEIAPRPHNSGHHTIEADQVSQFEQHLRAVLDLPLSPTKTLMPAAMVNLIGSDEEQGPPEYANIEAAADIFGAKFHIYGKKQCKPFRKMGHVTVIDKEMKEARQKAELIREKVTVRPEDAKKASS